MTEILQQNFHGQWLPHLCHMAKSVPAHLQVSDSYRKLPYRCYFSCISDVQNHLLGPFATYVYYS